MTAGRITVGLTLFACLAKLPIMNNSSDRIRAEERASIVKALAHPSRIFLAESLIRGERSVRELTEAVGADISTVSKHLSVMKNAGWVEAEKRGLQQFYRLRCPCLLDFFRCIDLINRSQKSKDVQTEQTAT